MRSALRVAPRLALPRSVVSVASPLRAISSTPVALQKKKEKAGSGPATAAVVENFDLKKQIPVNLLKDGGEPEYQADTAYPEWVFKLVDDKPLLEDYLMKGLENVSEEGMKGAFRMINKKRIKEGNNARRKDA